MQSSDPYLFSTRLNTLKKAIPTWITNLQGTGNMELNQVVNELHGLIHDVSDPTPDSAHVRSQVGSLYRRVQSIQGRHKEPYQSRLKELELELAKLRA
ncbi:MAG: hypothetical protein K8J31_29015 [Anaerolineae bacterium]|nr:hypothetical protein [Anaerolineae bacterium]